MDAPDLPPDLPPAPPPTGLLGALGAARRAIAGQPVAALHARPDMRRKIGTGEVAFFNRLIQILQAEGYGVVLLGLYRPPWLTWMSGRAVHLYRGPNRLWRRRRVFSIGKGYLEGYWYIDPKGYRDKSSVGERTFTIDDIAPDDVLDLFKRLKRRMVHRGASTRAQAARGTSEVPDGCIAIMLQLKTLFEYRRDEVCSDAEMVRAVVAARGDRPVVIKYHPFGAERAVRRAVEAVVDPAAGVHLTDANVHDILQAAVLVVTKTSGAGFEAMLHRKNVLLFADADYKAGATRLESLDDLPAAIDRAIAKKVLHGNFVYWYLERNLFHQDAPDFRSRLVQVIAANA